MTCIDIPYMRLRILLFFIGKAILKKYRLKSRFCPYRYTSIAQYINSNHYHNFLHFNSHPKASHKSHKMCLISLFLK